MRKRLVLWAIALASFAPGLSFAKGDTIRIVISGGHLSAPIEVSDPAIVSRFNVWSGSRASSGSLNVDWSRGVARLPSELEKYVVSFVTNRSSPSTYVVVYGWDARTKQGYVYIPSKADPSYQDNTWLIHRGIEGNWFYASKAWQDMADPLIRKRSVR